MNEKEIVSSVRAVTGALGGLEQKSAEVSSPAREPRHSEGRASP